MDKKEFLLNLRQSLSVLQEEELQDIISEYEQHIDMKVENGLTQEEAIADFGSMAELTSEILEAYHVRADYAESASGNPSHRASEDLAEDQKPADPFRKFQETLKKLGIAVSTGASRMAAAVKRGAAWGKCQIRRPLLWMSGIWKNGEKLLIQGQKKKGNSRRRFMERKEYDESQQGIISIIGSGINRIFQGCVSAALWCFRLGWNICCVGASLTAAFFGLFCLYGLGILIVLVLQGYPLMGLTLGCFGLVLCMFSLAGFGFTLRWIPERQREAKRDRKKRPKETKISWTDQEEHTNMAASNADTEGEQHA